MQTPLAHLQININPANMAFYKDLLGFLGWQPIYEDEGILGVGVRAPNALSLWFVAQLQQVDNDYDGPGMNHLAFRAASQGDVDAATTYLTERGVAPLFDTPRHRPEFAAAEDATYYQVMFASPDRILFEIVYTGPK